MIDIYFVSIYYVSLPLNPSSQLFVLLVRDLYQAICFSPFQLQVWFSILSILSESKDSKVITIIKYVWKINIYNQLHVIFNVMMGTKNKSLFYFDKNRLENFPIFKPNFVSSKFTNWRNKALSTSNYLILSTRDCEVNFERCVILLLDLMQIF